MPPRILWICWYQGVDQAPALIKACLNSWRTHAPGWELRILDAHSWQAWLPPASVARLPRFGQLSAAMQSDWLRLQLLQTHGGVWADATLLCRAPLEPWLGPLCTSGFFAFRDPGPDRLLSSWLLASEPSHPLTQAWLERFERFLLLPQQPWLPPLQKQIRQTLKRRFRTSPHAARLWCHPITQFLTAHRPYFSLHYCFAEAIRTEPRLQHLWNQVPRRPAAPCHWLQDEAQQPMRPALLQDLQQHAAPVFKLNRRLNHLDQPLIQAALTQ